jgi:hypothetical protein
MIEIITEGEGVETFDYAPEPLYTLNGKTVQCPTRFPAAVGLSYVDVMNRRGPDAAVSWLLRKALGDEAFTELMDTANPVPDEAMNAIVTAINSRMRAGAVAPKSPKTSSNGSSPTSTGNGSKKSGGSRSTPKKSRRTSPSSTG